MPDGENQNQPVAFTESLPEPLRANPVFADVKDIGDLATRYAGMHKPFAEQLPEDIRGEAMFKDIKSVDALAKGYHGAQKLLGVPKDQLLRLPTDPADAKQWEPIWNKLGRPEKADGYKLTVPEGMKIDPTFQEGFFKVAHENGVTNKGLDALYTHLRTVAEKTAATQKQTAESEIQKAGEALKTEWGQAYETKLKTGQAAIEHLDKELKLGGGLAKELDASKLGNLPALAKVFEWYGAQLREDGVIGKVGSGESEHSPVEAQQQINSLLAEPAFKKAYFDSRDPGHKAAVERVYALRQMAHPEPEGRAA